MADIPTPDATATDESGTTTGTWFALADREPDEREYVIWCRVPVEEPYWIGCMLCDDWCADRATDRPYTHWMPLPAPPATGRATP